MLGFSKNKYAIQSLEIRLESLARFRITKNLNFTRFLNLILEYKEKGYCATFRCKRKKDCKTVGIHLQEYVVEPERCYYGKCTYKRKETKSDRYKNLPKKSCKQHGHCKEENQQCVKVGKKS